jgi:CRP-like cAMP-binding protein
LQAIVKPVKYEEGKTIFNCGDPAESLFLIIEGEVEVLLPTETGQRKRLAMLSPGMSFGEMALLNHRTRSADVRTTCQSRFYQVVFDEIPEGKTAGHEAWQGDAGIAASGLIQILPNLPDR